MNDGNATIAGMHGRIERNRRAVENDLAVGGLLHARQDFHQGRFTGTIFTKQRGHRTGVDIEVHTLECAHATIVLDDVAGRQHRLSLLGLSLCRLDLAHGCTLICTGVTVQRFGLMSWKAPTTRIVLPLRLSRSILASTCFFMALLMPAAAFWYSIWLVKSPNEIGRAS